MNNMKKPSYKKIVLQGDQVEMKSTEDVVIVGYDEIMNNINVKGEKLNRKAKGLNNAKRELLVDLLIDVGNVTNHITEYYGFHGIGDSLQLEDVMNSFEQSLRVEVVDYDEYFISDEDDT